MVVKIDETNFHLYRSFLSEAYKYLEQLETEQNKTIIDDADRSDERTFTSITQYFKYIEEFKSSPRRDYFLLKLPLDETALEIDANTRNITIPASFVRSSIVQRDKVSETIIFTIDRFIDNVDLCNIEKVYVQWTAPDGNGGTREWATPIELIDRESMPEKIKFGWPVDEAVTLFPGKVSFSVTFFIPDDTEVGKVKYRLNTLPATFDVKAALQPDINSNSTINRPGTALNAAIRNNKYPGVGMKTPSVPEFNEPGLDLLEKEILVQDTITLRAQAVTTDEGIINYRWVFTPFGSDYKYTCGQKPVINEGDLTVYSYIFKPLTDEQTTRYLKAVDYELLTDDSKLLFEEYQPEEGEELEETLYVIKDASQNVEVFYNNIGSVGVAYGLIADPEKIDPRDRIYVQLEGGAWDLYTGADYQKDLELCEKFTTFTVSPEGSVIGEYFVEADNTIVGVVSNPQQSTSCYLEGPEDISIIQDLPENVFIEENYTYHRKDRVSLAEYDLILNKNKLELFDLNEGAEGEESYYTAKNNNTTVRRRKYTLEIALRPTQHTSFTYDWFNSDTEGTFADTSKIGGVNDIKYTTTDIGWYKIIISAKKNREEKVKETRVCRAIIDPVAPTLSIVEHDEGNVNTTSSPGIWYNKGEVDEYYSIDVARDGLARLVVNGAININGTDKKNDKLYSDKIKYEWRIYNEDLGSYEVLTAANHGEFLPSGSNSEFIDKSATEKFSDHPTTLVYKFNGKKVKIACYAINTLHTKDTFEESVAVTFEIA